MLFSLGQMGERVNAGAARKKNEDKDDVGSKNKPVEL